MKSIKITEEQLKRLEELRFTEQESESPEMEIGSNPIVPSVDITLEIADEISKLVQYFPDVAKGSGIDGLYKKIEFLSNPQQYANNMQQGVNAMIVLNYLKKLKDPKLFEASSSGFFFESFLCGLLDGAQRQDIEGKVSGAADIIDSQGVTYSLKLYSPKTTEIQIKSKKQTPEDVTNYVIIGVKHSANILEFIILETSKMTPENQSGVVKDRNGKWYITQAQIRNHEKSITIKLDYIASSAQIQEISGLLLSVVNDMEREMANLSNDITQLVTVSTDDDGNENVEMLGVAAKSHANNLDKHTTGLIDQSVDILTKVSDGPQ